MSIGFVLINTEIGFEKEVIDSLKKIDGVVEAHLLYGIYDIIAKIEAEDLNELKEKILRKVREVKHIRSTMTMITT